jgi:mRNA deadenylase 3'-5' endonuclease subunit Ccr4
MKHQIGTVQSRKILSFIDVSGGIKINRVAIKRRNLVVMTYNVLAQCYVRSSYFPYCNSKTLRWKTRSKMLVIYVNAT